MRWLFFTLPLSACFGGPTTFATVCDEANDVVQRCGATVPMLSNAPCTGIARFVSECVTEQTHGCDELATLMRQPERCFPDAGEDEAFPEAESLPFPEPRHLDGGLTP